MRATLEVSALIAAFFLAQLGRARHRPRRHRRPNSNRGLYLPLPPANWSVPVSSFSAPSHGALPA
jgi:hypothetical protein